MRQCSSTNERGLLILRRDYSSSIKKSLEQAIIKQTDHLNLAIENLAKLFFKGNETSLEILYMMLMDGKMLEVISQAQVLLQSREDGKPPFMVAWSATRGEPPVSLQ
jgi:hypothetical protein